MCVINTFSKSFPEMDWSFHCCYSSTWKLDYNSCFSTQSLISKLTTTQPAALQYIFLKNFKPSNLIHVSFRHILNRTLLTKVLDLTWHNDTDSVTVSKCNLLIYTYVPKTKLLRHVRKVGEFVLILKIKWNLLINWWSRELDIYSFINTFYKFWEWIKIICGFNIVHFFSSNIIFIMFTFSIRHLRS